MPVTSLSVMTRVMSSVMTDTVGVGSSEVPIPPAITNLGLWLDATDDSTISTATGASEWRDKSGNNYHAGQSTGAAQPATGNTLNGRKVLRFDGIDDRMTLPSGAFSLSNSNATMFLVYRNTGTNSNRQPINAQDGGSNRFRFIRTSGTQFGGTHGSNTGQSSVTTTSETTTGHIALLVSPDNTTNYRIYRGGTTLTGTDAPRTTFTATSFTIGSQTGTTNPWDGDIGEIIIYTRVLTNAERNLIGNYLASKWGLAWTNFSEEVVTHLGSPVTNGGQNVTV